VGEIGQARSLISDDALRQDSEQFVRFSGDARGGAFDGGWHAGFAPRTLRGQRILLPHMESKSGALRS
jgi:hypothetical protein